MAFNTIKTVLIACTTTVSASITLPVASGSVDNKGMYFRAWSDSGAVIFNFTGNASKTATAGALPDGNLPAQQFYGEIQQLPAGATAVTAIALAGTPNFFLEIGHLISG
jgi:hypothetical protein